MNLAQAVLTALRAERPAYQATRPSIVKVIEPVAIIGKPGKRRRRSLAFVERLVDQTRYPGHVLREIRRGGQARECSRRLARDCVQ